MLTKNPEFLPECQPKQWEINLISHNHHQHNSTNNKRRWEPGGKRMPVSCLWEYTLAIVSIMDSLWMPEKITLGEIKTRIWHPHTLAYMPRKPQMKRCMHPTYSAAQLLLLSPGERLLLNDETWDSWPPEEINSIRGQRRGWIAQSFCVIKFY